MKTKKNFIGFCLLGLASLLISSSSSSQQMVVKHSDGKLEIINFRERGGDGGDCKNCMADEKKVKRDMDSVKKAMKKTNDKYEELLKKLEKKNFKKDSTIKKSK